MTLFEQENGLGDGVQGTDMLSTRYHFKHKTPDLDTRFSGKMASFERENESGSIPDVDTDIVSTRNHVNRVTTYNKSQALDTFCNIDMINDRAVTIAADSEKDVENLCDQLSSVDMEDWLKRPRYDDSYTDLHHEVPLRPAFEDKFTSAKIYSKDNDGDTLLHVAIILREFELILMFISKAESFRLLSVQNFLFQSPLHLATLTNQPDVVRRLVVAGANLESRDKDGNTALHIACREGFIQCVQHLLDPVQYEETTQNSYELPYQKIPQDLSISNYEGLTCLHLAAMNGHLRIVKMLMDKDVDVNLREGKAGRTVLHGACIAGDVNLVRLLLRCKTCNINARAYDDSTPFDLARARAHDDVCMILAAAGARYGEEYSDSE